MGPFLFSTSPDESALCRRCGEAVATGRTCIAAPQLAVSGLGKYRSNRLHPACALDVSAEALVALFDEDSLVFDGREALEAVARERLARRASVNCRSKKKKDDDVEPDPPAIELARDPRGRPRVRVLFVGSGSWSLPSGEADPFSLEEVLRDATLVSSKREYVFVRHSSGNSLAIDPSQPWAACVYWQKVDNGVAWAHGGKVADWCALGLAAPILVVLGAGADVDDKRDAIVQQLRKLAAKGGFDADDCPVVASPTVGAGLVEALALALDERADQVSGELSSDRVARTIDQLEALVREGREEAVVATAKKCVRFFNRARVAEKSRILDALFAAIANKNIAPSVLDVVFASRITLTTAWLVAVAKLQLEDGARRLAHFDALCIYWRSLANRGDEALPALLVDAIERERAGSERAKMAAKWLPSLAAAESVARLKALRAASSKQRAKVALVDAILAEHAKIRRAK
ncbi:MAG: hypothetical protein JNK05_36665 [Myxococcales bacterium]|nr:hypothetical protein [Myxococcales bacterium]